MNEGKCGGVLTNSNWAIYFLQETLQVILKECMNINKWLKAEWRSSGQE